MNTTPCVLVLSHVLRAGFGVVLSPLLQVREADQQRVAAEALKTQLMLQPSAGGDAVLPSVVARRHLFEASIASMNASVAADVR